MLAFQSLTELSTLPQTEALQNCAAYPRNEHSALAERIFAQAAKEFSYLRVLECH